MSKFNLQIDGKGKSTTEGNWDWWYGGGEAAWSSLANAKLGVPLAIRKGKTVGVFEGGEVVEYIWGENDLTDNGLVLKQGSLSENLAFTNVDNDFSANQTFQEATFDRAFSENQAVANNELVRLDQLNSAISGLNWQHPVLDNIDLTTSEPTTPTVGDRYINSANGTSSVTGQSVNANDIYEWDGLTWAEYTPSEGWTVWDESVDQNYTFNGTDWVEFGSTVSHNNTTGLQGGQSGQYYHLTEAQFLAVSGDIDAVTLNGENGAYYLNYNNFTNIPNLSNFLVAADIVGKANLSGDNNFTGNQAINGIISANNLSGTNTGDETKVSIDALGVDSATLEGENGAYYLDYNNLNNKPTTDNYGYFQLQTNSVNRKQIASQNVVNFLNGNGISVSYSDLPASVTITNTNIVTNNNQITNGAGYVTSSGNTVIGTSDDIVTPSTTVINRINLTDGVIDSFTTRNLTLADLGYTGDTDANKITNNTQITNGRGFVTSSGNTVIGTDLDISNTGAQVIESLNMTDGVITSHTVRNLSLGNLGYTGDTDANKITDNSQIGNGRGYITSYVNTQLTKEQVEDFVGGMVTGNTETNISVTYNDTTGKLNFVSVNTQLSNAQVTAITNPLYLGKTAKAVDSDKLDGQDSTYYLNYNNFSNTPNLGVYAKLSGGNEFSGTQIFSGNVGIGTSSPIYKQHISTSEFIGQFIQSSYVNSLKYYSSTLIGRNAVNNESSEFGYLYDSVNPNNSYSYINTFGQIQGSQFVLTAIGNVGIGTNSPQAKLDVNGNAIFSGDVEVGGELIINSSTNESTLNFNGSNGDSNIIYNSSQNKFDIEADVFVDGTIQTDGYKSADGSEGISIDLGSFVYKNGLLVAASV